MLQNALRRSRLRMHHPRRILIDPQSLRLLPPPRRRERSSRSSRIPSDAKADRDATPRQAAAGLSGFDISVDCTSTDDDADIYISLEALDQDACVGYTLMHHY